MKFRYDDSSRLFQTDAAATEKDWSLMVAHNMGIWENRTPDGPEQWALHANIICNHSLRPYSSLLLSFLFFKSQHTETEARRAGELDHLTSMHEQSVIFYVRQTEADLTVGHGRPLVQWPTGPLRGWALEDPGRGARPKNNGSCIEFMIYLMILPQNH